MAIKGLSHITLVCADLDRMEEVLVKVLRARRVYDSGTDTFSVSEERFFIVGEANPYDELDGVWMAVMKGDPLDQRSYNHIGSKARGSRCISMIMTIICSSYTAARCGHG